VIPRIIGKAIHFRVQAGVLQLTLGISVVIAVLCASIILLAYYTKITFLQQDISLKLRNNAISGINYVMAQRTSLPFNQFKSWDLFGEETDSVTILRKPWGIFEVAVAIARQGQHTAVKSAMITALPDAAGQAALYIPDNNAPVYLVGKTSITGTVYASSRKFSTGFIDGKGYERDKLIDGEVKKSESLIPKVDTVLLYEIKLMMQTQTGAYNLKFSDRLPVGKRISFETPETEYYFSNQSIDLEDSLAGNIIIQSAIKIRVTASARLSDVILLAPDIDIDKGFEGNLQCFATRSITVGAESKMKYPTTLALIGGEQDSTIVIRRDAEVQGVVIIPGHDQTIGSRGVFKIEEKGVFHGMAYINGAADIQGSLWGHMTTRTTQVRIESTVYGNHILNGEINAEKRSEHMPASLLWANSKALIIAKWLQ
jgi:hypothetical protein